MSPRTPSAGAHELVDAGLDLREAEGVALTERGRPASPAPTLATDYVHTMHPDTGLDVVFVPGERLPEWAVVVATPAEEDPDEDPDYEAMSVSELNELAASRGIDTAPLTLKADLVEALEAIGQEHRS